MEQSFPKRVLMSQWADGLLSVWMFFVAAFYFGGYFLPVIGQYTAQASAVYAFMLLVSVAAYLGGRSKASGQPVPDASEGVRAARTPVGNRASER